MLRVCSLPPIAMEFDAEAGSFGRGGGRPDDSAGQPLAQIRAGAQRDLDREWAFRFLTERYVDKGFMTSHRRSNLLAKVYGRTRMNAVSQGGKKLARIFSVSAHPSRTWTSRIMMLCAGLRRG